MSDTTSEAVTPSQIPRRRVFQAAVPLFVPGAVLGLSGAVPPSDRINVAGLGIGGRGERDLESFLAQDDVQFRAICDARNERREAIKSKVDKHHGNNDCEMYGDMFELWERRDIDAVLIATGDRWHTLLSILTAKSGKDVYCEKPCSMTIAESRALADAYHRLGRVYQAGTQRRNGTNFEYCIDLARSGKLGKLTKLHANAAPGDRYTPSTTHDWLPAEPEPPKSVVDWDRWLGPAPWRPTSEYSTVASLSLDIIQVTSHEIRGIVTQITAVRFEGEDAWVQTGDAGIVEASDSLARYRKTFEDAREATTRHVRDFLNCVKSREDTRAIALAACQTHVACHAAYIAYQLGETLEFDPATDSFPRSDAANRMRSRAMRRAMATRVNGGRRC